jgi:dGTPase
MAERLSRDQLDAARALELDPDVAEAAALAHDLGHPPFGHVAETQLDHLMEKEGLAEGFEGNAQSFRVVNKLALHFLGHPGLNLTRATLNGMLKYPCLHLKGKDPKKWGAYQTEEPEFRWARQEFESGDLRRSVEAEVMDWADDVTYAVHDAGDFYRAGLMPLDRLTLDESERKRFFDGMERRYAMQGKPLPYPRAELERVFHSLIQYFPIHERYRGTNQHRCLLRAYTAQLIRDYIYAVELSLGARPSGRFVSISEGAVKEVTVWKELTWYYVILNPSLATQQEGQRRVISGLFDIFGAAAKHHRYVLFPDPVREELEAVAGDTKAELRTVADMIAGMAERQAVDMYLRLTGVSLGSALARLV